MGYKKKYRESREKKQEKTEVKTPQGIPKNKQQTVKSDPFFNVSKYEKKYKNHLQDKELEGLSDLQKVFQKKLEGSKFRILNEKLYTSTGEEALKMFKEDPSLYEIVNDF